MIPADRFIVQKHDDEAAWLGRRRIGVTATAVADIAGRKDRAAAIRSWLFPEPFDGNPYTEFGNEQEPVMMRSAHHLHGILPSDWLIAGENPLHLATPDGLSLDHTRIAECKTTGDPWDSALEKQTGVPIRYRRQVQWQLHVTGATECLFVWQLRVPDGGWFRPAWFTPRTVWIPRDDAMITELVSVADDMLTALGRSAA